MKAHWSYLKYVLRHKWFVYLWCRRIGQVSLWRAIIHDWSKFLPCEWFPYVDTFYSKKPEPGYGDARNHGRLSPQECERIIADRKAAFDRAWNHHQKFNKHHWQYWLLTNDSDEPKSRALRIPLPYVNEMVADWCGAGQAINGKMEVWSWYEKNYDKIILHEDTRRTVDACIGFIEEMHLSNERAREIAARLGIYCK